MSRASASTRSGSRRSSSRRWRTSATTSRDYRAVDPIFGTLADFDRADRARRTALGLKVIIDQVLSATPRTSTPGSSESRQSRDNRQGRLVRLGRPASPTARRRTTGCRSSAARPGNGNRAAASTTCTTSWSSQPDLNFHNPDVAGRAARRRRLLARARRRRLPPRCDQLLLPRSARCATTRRRPKPSARGRGFRADNPYAFQDHLYDKTQPEILAVPGARCARCSTVSRRDRARRGSADGRASLRPWPSTPSGGEAPAHGLQLRAARRDDFSPRHIRDDRRDARGALRRRLAVLGDLATTTSSAWRAAGGDDARDRAALAKLLHGAAPVAARLGLHLPGRGTRADAKRTCPFEQLRDPYGIALLARVQGPRRLPHADAVGSERDRTPASRRGRAVAAGAGGAPRARGVSPGAEQISVLKVCVCVLEARFACAAKRRHPFPRLNVNTCGSWEHVYVFLLFLILV